MRIAAYALACLVGSSLLVGCNRDGLKPEESQADELKAAGLKEADATHPIGKSGGPMKEGAKGAAKGGNAAGGAGDPESR